MCVFLFYFVLCGTESYGAKTVFSKEEAYSASIDIPARIGILVENSHCHRRIIGVVPVNISLRRNLIGFTSTKSTRIAWCGDESLTHILGIVDWAKEGFHWGSFVGREKYLASVGDPDCGGFPKISIVVIPGDFVPDFQMWNLDLAIPDIRSLVLYKLLLTQGDGIFGGFGAPSSNRKLSDSEYHGPFSLLNLGFHNEGLLPIYPSLNERSQEYSNRYDYGCLLSPIRSLNPFPSATDEKQRPYREWFLMSIGIAFAFLGVILVRLTREAIKDDVIFGFLIGCVCLVFLFVGIGFIFWSGGEF